MDEHLVATMNRAADHLHKIESTGTKATGETGTHITTKAATSTCTLSSATKPSSHAVSTAPSMLERSEVTSSLPRAEHPGATQSSASTKSPAENEKFVMRTYLNRIGYRRRFRLPRAPDQAPHRISGMEMAGCRLKGRPATRGGRPPWGGRRPRKE